MLTLNNVYTSIGANVYTSIGANMYTSVGANVYTSIGANNGSEKLRTNKTKHTATSGKLRTFMRNLRHKIINVTQHSWQVHLYTHD